MIAYRRKVRTKENKIFICKPDCQTSKAPKSLDQIPHIKLICVDLVPYSARFCRGDILADSPVTAKNLPSKLSTLNNNGNSVTA